MVVFGVAHPRRGTPLQKKYAVKKYLPYGRSRNESGKNNKYCF